MWKVLHGHGGLFVGGWESRITVGSGEDNEFFCMPNTYLYAYLRLTRRIAWRNDRFVDFIYFENSRFPGRTEKITFP